MIASELIAALEQFAPLNLQESYDNAGVQIGDFSREVSSCLISLDITPEVVEEAIANGIPLIISHHPLIFRGIKQITPVGYINQSVIKAIKHDILLYSVHTNIDKASGGVNYRIGEELGLTNIRQLSVENIAINSGLGVIGETEEPLLLSDFLERVKTALSIPVIRCSKSNNRTISRVALCGGSGSDLLPLAKSEGADIFLTSDLSYHAFFEGTECFTIADFGHYESEQVTKRLIGEIIRNKFPNFAVRITGVNTNPINYI